MVKQGEEIEVMIIEIDRERERVSLGLKQLADNLGKDRRTLPDWLYSQGQGRQSCAYGAFIEIQEGVEGLDTLPSFHGPSAFPNQAKFLA